MNAYTHSVSLKSFGKDLQNIIVHQTFGDGSCLTHALCHALYTPYHSRLIDGRRVTTAEVIAQFRSHLSESLTAINPLTNDIYYYSLAVPYEVDALKSLLLGTSSLDDVMILLVSVIYNVNVYIINEDDTTIMRIGEKARDSVLVQHSRGHFNGVSVKDTTTGVHNTRITPNTPLLVLLNKYISK